MNNNLAPNVTTQIQSYLAATNNHADPNALYLIDAGGDDARVALMQSGTAAQTDYMIQQAHTLAQLIEQLYAAGARYIVSSDHVWSGILGKVFVDTLWTDLADAGVPFIPAQELKNVIQAVNANPSAYGISNTVQPPHGPFTPSNPYNVANGGADIDPIPNLPVASWALYATQMVSPTAGQTYLWADDDHLSAAGQKVTADYLHNLIENAAPRVSETLTASADVAGNPSAQVTFRWQELAPGQTAWTDIVGATASTYVVKAADIGFELRVQASYIDSSGQTTSVTSAASVPVTLAGSSGNAVFGTSGNDTFHAINGKTFIGAGGHDVLLFTGGRSQYNIVANTDGSLVVNDTISNRDGSNTTNGVEFLQFSDKTIFVENNDNANIARLYSAAFDRAPDLPGLSFWEDVYSRSISSAAKSAGYYVALAQTNTGSGGSIATGFMQSSEFQNKYGALNDSAFVNLLYQNVLGRAPDQAGLDFWVNQLGPAHQTREVVLVGFAESPENVAKTSADWLVLA